MGKGRGVERKEVGIKENGKEKGALRGGMERTRG